MLQTIKDPYKERYIIVGNRADKYPERNGLGYTKVEADCVMRKICLLSAADALRDEEYEKADEFLSNFAGKPIRIFDTVDEIYRDDVEALKKIGDALEEKCYERGAAEQQQIEALRGELRSGAPLSALLESISEHKQKTISKTL